MRKIVIALVGILAVSTWVLAAAPPDVKKFETSNGTVTFPHGAHAKAGIKCTECHHKDTGEKMEACSACHEKAAKEKTPSLKDAIHKACWGCHKKTAEGGKKAGPQMKDCKICHVKQG